MLRFLKFITETYVTQNKYYSTLTGVHTACLKPLIHYTSMQFARSFERMIIAAAQPAEVHLHSASLLTHHTVPDQKE